MIRHIWLYLVVLAALLTTLGACKPSAPAPTPTSNIPLPISQPVSPTTASAAPADAEWEKVVAAARKEGSVTLYSFNFIGEVGLGLSRAFQEKYGVKVDIVTGRGAEFLERLKTERRMGKIVADFTEGSSVNVMNIKVEGLTLSGMDGLPALKELEAFRVSPFNLDPADKQVAGYNISVHAPYVNVNMVKPGDEPKRWRDLLDPKWKGKMMLSDPKLSTNAYLLFVPLLREKVVDEEYLKALYKQDLQWTVGTVDELGKIGKGQIPLSVRISDTVAAPFALEGAPIQAIDMEDGITVGFTVVAMLNGPHPNASKLFTNWLFTREGQNLRGKLSGASSFRKDTEDFRPKGTALTPKRPIVTTNEDTDNAARLFREKWLDKLWGR